MSSKKVDYTSKNSNIRQAIFSQPGFGTNFQLILSLENTTFVCLNQAVLRFNLLYTDSTGASPAVGCTFLKPIIGWINNLSITISMHTGETFTLSSMQQRGMVGSFMQLSSPSLSKVDDFNAMNLITVPYTTNANVSTLSFSIELRYLIDFFAAERYLNIKDLNINMTMDQRYNIVDLPNIGGTNQTKLDISTIHLNYYYYSLNIERTSPRMLMLPPIRTFTQIQQVPVGNQTQTIVLAIAGSVQVLFYWYSSIDSSNLYNAYANSTPSYHSYNIGSNTFPLTPQIITDVNNPVLGTDQHYFEFMNNISKIHQEKSSYITYNNYVSKYRFYSIECYSNRFVSGSSTLTVQHTNAPDANLYPNGIQMIITCLYIPVEYMTA
jgi:hypothetical protein